MRYAVSVTLTAGVTTETLERTKQGTSEGNAIADDTPGREDKATTDDDIGKALAPAQSVD